MQKQDPNSLPRVVPATKISLTDLETCLIQNVHRNYAKVILEKEFDGGFSGTRVFLALPVRAGDAHDARVVTKLGKADGLRREFENYQNHASRALPFATAQARDFYEQDGWAAFNYVFVGDAELGQSLSLEDYYHAHSAREVVTALENLFGKALGPMWYSQARPLTCPFQDEYGRHLPPAQELEEILQKIFPKAVSPDGRRVAVPGVAGTFPNPLVIYQGLLDQTLTGRTSFVHGDLHPRNVLVDESGKGWLIDFAKVRERHNLFDFIKLENHLRLMVLAQVYGAFSLNEYVQFEQALNAGPLGQNSTPPANPELEKAYQVMMAIRRVARKYMGPEPDFRNEYFPALFLYNLAMLKYYSPDQITATQLIFVTACSLAADIFEERKTMQTDSTNGQNPSEKQQPPAAGTGGISIGGKVEKSVLVVGNQNNITQVNSGAQITPVPADEIARAFATIMMAVEREQDRAKKEKAEKLVQKLDVEARKDEQQVDADNVEDWFTVLATVSADAWEVAVATLASPIAGISTVFRKIVQRIKDEKKAQRGK